MRNWVKGKVRQLFLMLSNRRKSILKWFLILGGVILSSYVFGFSINCFIAAGFHLKISARLLFDGKTFLYSGVLCGLFLFFALYYYYTHYWIFNSKNIIKGKERDKHIAANLEQARFETETEIAKNFQTVYYDELPNTEVKGIPIIAYEEKQRLKVTFSPSTHALAIGTTGSGKTTTFVNPTIQILATSKTKPSMIISDPKGELYQMHAKKLKGEGYTVKILDLRNPYNSVRWNPMESAYLNYTRMLNLEKEVIIHEDRGTYEFEGKEYYNPKDKDAAVQVKKQQLSDIVYEDLHDIITVLCPITNKNEPMWEGGARNFVLAIALAMLEDCANPELNMTKEKYNFYSLMKVATSTDDECTELLNYFKGRSPLSKAVSLSKQVLDSSDKTRGSYLSSTFDKLSMFADLSLCALTSQNEIEFAEMGEKPIALFLQIPDEKETRHTLAAMVILQAYKELVRKANDYPTLSLPRPVYFILDEFGQLPQIHKLEQMITVGRSRNIWLNLVVQSYAQLAKVYDEKSADIIKSNCNTQIFIGTTDYKTIEEFSKRCGNYSIVQRSVGFNTVRADDVNSNTSVKERPLIYPSELQQLNSKGNMGNAIVTVFGYQPIKAKFTPSYQSKFYDLKMSEQELLVGRYFDEAAAFYDMKARNAIVSATRRKSNSGGSVREQIAERRRQASITEKLQMIVANGVQGIATEQELGDLFMKVQSRQYDKAITQLKQIAERVNDIEHISGIQNAIARLEETQNGEIRVEKK
ncbi:MAG: type IV secretory system conjugative DNA transfer family protein [Clostridiales bacterium]|nr:type IV secretory system conjugative DNA transfer family protein [Clostridiales bacterium]